VATWRTYGERKLGPYWRLVYSVEGRQRTVYLGRFGTLVRQVRARLRHVQHYRNLRRFINRSVRETKGSLRTAKQLAPREQSHFRGEDAPSVRRIHRAGKIGTVPVNGYPRGVTMMGDRPVG